MFQCYPSIYYNIFLKSCRRWWNCSYCNGLRGTMFYYHLEAKRAQLAIMAGLLEYHYQCKLLNEIVGLRRVGVISMRDVKFSKWRLLFYFSYLSPFFLFLYALSQQIWHVSVKVCSLLSAWFFFNNKSSRPWKH